MKHFNENASVIYTDAKGRQIDTFVVFETDMVTGLTQINYRNMRVSASSLNLHAKTIGRYHMPLDDSFSFEILSKLKDKYQMIDAQRKTLVLQPKTDIELTHTLSIAS